jgi:outer membrane protein assembly factor BamB
MNNWQKSITICLIFLLAASSTASFLSKVTAETINPMYAGTKSIDSSLEIKFSKNNNSILYLDSDNSVIFSVGFGRYTFDYMSLGTFIYSVSYKTSWQNSPVQVYKWSFNDPANLNDDDPNPKQSTQDTISLKDAPLGKQQITVTALAGDYVTDFSTYWIFTVNTSITLNLTVATPPPKTPMPTFSYESGILWRTNLPWNLTGTPAQNVWQSDINGEERTWTNPVINKDIVYAAATSSVMLNRYGNAAISWINIYAFDASTGSLIWDYQDNFSKVTSLAFENGVIYFGVSGGGYYDSLGNRRNLDSVNALDASNGILLWRTPCTIFFSSPVVYEGRVFIGSGHSVLALDATNGNIIWNYTTNAGVLSSATVTNDIVYIGSYDANLYALDAKNGNKLWNFIAQQGFFYAPAVSNGVVFASSQDGNIYALNAAYGSKIWSYDTSPPKIGTTEQIDQTFDPSTPYIYNNVLYVSSSGLLYDQSKHDYGNGYSTIYALDSQNGHKIWNYTIDTWGANSPTVANGIVYANIYPYTIYGLEASNGAKIWNYSNVQTDPVIAENVIYLGIEGQIYAIRISPSYSLPATLTLLPIAITVAIIAIVVFILLLFRRHRKPISQNKPNV